MMGRWVLITAVMTGRYIVLSREVSCADHGGQVTIEINTNLPKKEPKSGDNQQGGKQQGKQEGKQPAKENGTQETSQEGNQEGGEEVKKRYEFTLPASLLE